MDLKPFMRQARYAASQGSCAGLYLVWWLGHMALRPVAMYKCTSDSNKAVFFNWQELCDFVTGLFFDQLSLAENLENFKLTAVMRPNRSWKRCKINQTKERTNEHTKERRSKQASKQTIKQANKQTNKQANKHCQFSLHVNHVNYYEENKFAYLLTCN